MPDQTLIRELAYRVDNNPDAWTGIFDEVVDSTVAPAATVFDFPTPDVFPINEDESHAAHTADLEPEKGDDDYHGGA